MKKLIIISLLACLCLMACRTTVGVLDKSVPLREQVKVTIKSPYVGYKAGDKYHLFYGKIQIFNNLPNLQPFILPAGEQTVRAKWKVSRTIDGWIYTADVEDSITYNFTPGKEYTIDTVTVFNSTDKKFVSSKLVIEEKDGKIRSVIPMWIGGSIGYTGWMYPNSIASTLGMKQGVDIFFNKAELRITAEATAGLGYSFLPVIENAVLMDYSSNVSDVSDYENDHMGAGSGIFTAGLKTKYLFTNEFGIALGLGVTGAYSIYVDSELREEYINDMGEIDYRRPSGLMPVIPYLQAQVNFRKGRTKAYPSWPVLPLSIYFNYYPILPSGEMSTFGVGLVLLDM